MAKFMVPDYVQFVDTIPKTPTGKAEKYRLKGTGVGARG
jgi:acyl-coenzyme A synthetase/AMP-(fatty) acid ligase